MRKCSILVCLFALTAMTSGCCKGLKTKDDNAAQENAAVVVEQPHTQVTTDPSPNPEASTPVQHEEPTIIEEQEVVAEPPVDNKSSMIWLIYAAMAAIVGWLAYKFIFRKR